MSAESRCMTLRLLTVITLVASATVLVALSRVGYRPAGPIATVDTLALMERMLELPEFADPRTAEIERLQGELQTLDTRLRSLISQLQELEPNDATGPALQMQAQQVQQQLMQQQREAQFDIDAFAAEQFAQAFKRVRAASGEVARSAGYMYAVTSRADDSNLQTGSTSLFVQEILYRTALVAPEGVDITEQVAQHLSLPEPAQDVPAVMPEAPAIEPGG